MDKSPHDFSFSFSKRYFGCTKMISDEDDEEKKVLTFNSSSHFFEDEAQEELSILRPPDIRSFAPPKKKHSVVSVSKLLSALMLQSKTQSQNQSRLGTRVIGTLFGHRRGHVHFAFQEASRLNPTFLIELSMPTSVLVREMASGLVRIAVECERKSEKKRGKTKKKLLDEAIWRTYCNGKKCGYAMRRDCGAEEWKVLKAVEPITMGAGVLPVSNGSEAVGSEGEVMYLRARFERVVGSKDSEVFYMLNPDGPGGPELSIYLLRV